MFGYSLLSEVVWLLNAFFRTALNLRKLPDCSLVLRMLETHGGFCMAHVSKYTKGNMQGLSIHLDRKTDNHSNKDIDTSRSHLNYDLRGEGGDTLNRLNARLSDVHCLNREKYESLCIMACNAS